MRSPRTINAFDCDGVITVGIYPGPDDVIITGRSYDERPETEQMLAKKGIKNLVHYNQLPYDEKTRTSSGVHKAQTLRVLKSNGVIVENFFEDDPVQWKIIEESCPWVNVVHVVHDLTEKENVRAPEYQNTKGTK